MLVQLEKRGSASHKASSDLSLHPLPGPGPIRAEAGSPQGSPVPLAFLSPCKRSVIPSLVSEPLWQFHRGWSPGWGTTLVDGAGQGEVGSGEDSGHWVR